MAKVERWKNKHEGPKPTEHIGWMIFSGATPVYPTMRTSRRDCIRDYLDGSTDPVFVADVIRRCRKVRFSEYYRRKRTPR